MLCPSCDREVRTGSLFCHYCGHHLDNTTGQQPGTPTPVQVAPGEDEPFLMEIPSCDYCDRQDDTLRIVAYPYVVSFVIVTFRRAFSGLMCRKHRNLYLALAGGITATIGWIGIPYGFIFAPIALFQLARGGSLPEDLNLEMLKTLAKHKTDQGDIDGAIRCLESCLQFRDENEIRNEVQQYRRRQLIPQAETTFRSRLSSTVALLLGAAMIGTVVGSLDYVLTLVFSVVLSGEIPIYVAILSWTPFVAMAFVGGLALAQLIEWALVRLSLTTRIIAIGLGGLSALVAAYSIPQGQAISDLLFYLLSGGTFESTFEFIFTSGFVTFVGGVYWIMSFLEETNPAGLIFVSLIAVILVYYLMMAIRTAIRTANWQSRLFLKDQALAT